jgi:hypothetical protein
LQAELESWRRKLVYIYHYPKAEKYLSVIKSDTELSQLGQNRRGVGMKF